MNEPEESFAKAVKAGNAAEDGEPVADGGAALRACGMMQFTDDGHNDALAKALLRHCGPDTTDLVFI